MTARVGPREGGQRGEARGSEPCVRCEGQGGWEAPVEECCGQFRWDGQCCGWPETINFEWEECPDCGGSGTSPPQQDGTSGAEVSARREVGD